MSLAAAAPASCARRILARDGMQLPPGAKLWIALAQIKLRAFPKQRA